MLLVALPAFAQIQKPAYTPATPDDTEHLTWFTAQPYGAQPSPPWFLNGVFFGPYSAFLTAHPTVGWIDLYCIDMAHYAITGGGGWDAWFSPVVGDLTYTRGGNAAQPQYEELTWYASQMRLDNRAEWVGIHAAMWNVFTPGHPRLLGPTDYSGQIAYWQGEWAAASGSYTPSPYWHVVTHAVDGELGRGQEHLTYVTPEPETIFLLGTGLAAVLGMSLVMRRSLG
jgi:hypothetical protein